MKSGSNRETRSCRAAAAETLAFTLSEMRMCCRMLSREEWRDLPI